MSRTDTPLPGLATQARPRLRPEVERRVEADGRLLLSCPGAAQLAVSAIEAPALALLDGTLDLEQLVRQAMALSPPLRPLSLLRLLRSLHLAGLIAGLEQAERHLFGQQRSKRPGRGLARLLDLRAEVAELAPLVGWGRVLPAWSWSVLEASATLALLAFLVLAGLSRYRLDLLPGARSPWLDLGLLYGGAAALLSLRAVLQGLALRSFGLAVPRAGLRLAWGVLHLGTDLTARATAPPGVRIRVTRVGLATLALAAGVAGCLALELGSVAAARSAVAAVLLLLLQLTPWVRTDTSELLAALTGIPGTRRRTLRFLLWRLGRNLRRAEPATADERHYLLLASVWIGHGVLALYVLLAHLLPSALARVSAALHGPGTAGAWLSPWLVAGLLLVGLLLLLAGLLAVALAAVLLVTVVQLLQPRFPRPAPGVRLSEAERGDLLALLGQTPLFLRLDEAARRLLVERMALEAYRPGQVVLAQGAPRDRLCLLLEGGCTVEFEESSGIVHLIGQLDAGDCFGELGLLRGGVRGATVRAASPVRLASLSRAALEAAKEALAVGFGVLAEELALRDALSRTPGLLHLAPEELDRLRAATDLLQVPSGTEVVRQDARDEAFYVIRQGVCAVLRRDGDGAEQLLARLGDGEHFGELAPLTGGQRTATVRAEEPTTLLRVSGAVLREVMLSSFLAAAGRERGFTEIHEGRGLR